MQVQGNRHRRREHPCYEIVGMAELHPCVQRAEECSVQEFSAGQDLLKCLVKDVSKKGSIPADVWFPLTAL